MKRVVFLLGVPDRDAYKTGNPVSDSDFDMINEVAEKLDITIDIVFAVPDVNLSGRAKEAKMSVIRDHRDAVIADVLALKPDAVVACGPVALKCLTNKGTVSVKENQRENLDIPELGDIVVVVTHGMEMIAANPGMDKWLVLDTYAALHGRLKTEWGKYYILDPDTSEWHTKPKALAKAKIIGLDLETFPGLDPWADDARIRMAVVSDKVGRAWLVQSTPDSRFPTWLVDMMADPAVLCGGSNIKFDYKWLKRFGYMLTNMHDTSTTEHILDCTNPLTDLKSLTFKYVPKLGDYSKGHRALVKERGGWEFVEDHEMYDYTGGDGESSIGTMLGQLKEIKQQGLMRPYRLSMDLYALLAEMETRGACVNMRTNRKLDREFNKEIGKLREQIYATLGPINLNSPYQLADALLRVVPGIKLNKKNLAGQFNDWRRPRNEEEEEDLSTGKDILERESHKHPVIAMVLLYRRLTKLHGTYVESLHDKHMVKHNDGQYYVHTSYRPDVVETYRLSSQGPNLQNIPRKPEPDEPHPIPQHLNIKNQYVSRFKGGKILEADLSQAEIREAADLSGDKALIAALTSGEDVHQSITATFHAVPFDSVTKLMRTQGKRQTFLVIYGGGANTLSRQIGVNKERAEELLRMFFNAFPELDAFINKVKLDVKRNLYSESVFGYRRKFRKPPSWDCWDGWRIERQAWNHQVQNGAACITYVAMLNLESHMRMRGMKSLLVMQVHDSILIDCYPGEEDTVAWLAKECLEHPTLERYGVKMQVPLVADVEVGKSWGTKEKIEV